MGRTKSSPKKTSKVNLPRPESPNRWKVEEDLRTLRRAGEVKNDPKRMAQVKKLAAKESESFNKIAKTK